MKLRLRGFSTYCVYAFTRASFHVACVSQRVILSLRKKLRLWINCGRMKRDNVIVSESSENNDYEEKRMRFLNAVLTLSCWRLFFFYYILVNVDFEEFLFLDTKRKIIVPYTCLLLCFLVLIVTQTQVLFFFYFLEKEQLILKTANILKRFLGKRLHIHNEG